MLVTGGSGSGKTTLAHALVRFLDHSGSYLLGGVEARTLPQAAVRRVVGLAEQQPYLFDDTIRQNLLFARPEADAAVLEDVLERVGLASWVAPAAGWMRGSASGARSSRAARPSGSPWHGRCWPTSTCWCWMSRQPRSTRRWRMLCWPICCAPRRGERWC
ncbi:putative multidrug export ATP-binding/permease protein [Rathayibacter tanaceti]|uniref:Putative multidrug export ATP-binding/permease protein n=1 Tax=Rathayibacter tanaceti TaxID=1671680 RepID=A0A162IYQ8_9MICO|nr:putative multidrug export ATP-binding/permease protein [Rathayibacter tanaceti]